MTAIPHENDPPPQDVLVEVYDPAPSEVSPAPGICGRLRRRSVDLSDAKVLVVAHEILLRTVLAEALRFAGVGVIDAADAAEAFDILSERRDIAVLVADVSVPGLVDDLALVWRSSVDHPDLPLVMTSALLEPDSREIPPGAIFIQKPFTPDLLVEVIKPLLDHQPGEAVPPLTMRA
jgi:two-component system, response regulator PdtaR